MAERVVNPQGFPAAGNRFKKGQSGNPGGVPRWVSKARKLAGTHCDEAIRVLREAMEDEDSRVRVYAAAALLDRAGVRPVLYDGEKAPKVKIRDRIAAYDRLASRIASLRPPAPGGGSPGGGAPGTDGGGSGAADRQPPALAPAAGTAD